jgi:hypothetical protein
MNADSTFRIGKDHLVCEDYALSAYATDIGYGIVCDGCSASPDVDFGARALAMAAKNRLWFTGIPWATEVLTMGRDIIWDASKIYSLFPRLHPQALDSTLLMAWVQNKKMTAYLYGDGVLVHRNTSKGTIYYWHIHLSKNAPDYLSYHLDSDRKEAYDKMDNSKEIIYTNYNPESSGVCTSTSFHKPFEPVVVQKDVEEGDIIAVISDGIDSFKKSDGSPIPYTDLIDDFTLVGEATAGVFITRRINGLLKKCAKENWTYRDDISIATIIV